MFTDFDLSIALATHDKMLLFAVVFITTYGLISILRQIILKRFSKWAKKTPDTFDDFLVSLIRIWDYKIITIFSLYIATTIIRFESAIGLVMRNFLVLVTIFYLTLSLQHLIKVWIDRVAEKQQKKQGSFDAAILMFIKNTFQFILWTIVGLLLLQNYGVNVTALVGGLGIGGIALAFAVQSILGDLISSISIYFDKPFKVGDYIEFGSEGGTVKNVGIKTTRLETVTGDQLVVANKQLTETEIHNYQRLKNRQVNIVLAIDLRTSTTKLADIPNLIKDQFKNIPQTKLMGTYFKSISETAYHYEIIYLVTDPDYTVYRETNHTVNLHITHMLAKQKIEYPFGKQEVVLRK